MTNYFLLFMTINNALACSSSLLINGLLIYMIWFKSTADLKNYQTFFLIYNAIDVCFTIVVLSTHMARVQVIMSITRQFQLFITHDGNVVFVASGFVTYFGRWPAQIFLMAQVFIYPFTVTIIPCTYIYRYLLLCR
uniref:Serpentine receptor class gamma n=1 Tax=Steinernema glaseri TaxID=37863 RepID=A0A1I8A009_9BILA